MSLERQQLQNIGGNRESTMNKAPSNSAGMLILILRGIYAHLFSGNDDNAKLENLNSAFQACITELRNLATTDHERSLIDLIATRANEAPSSLDNVTLYLPSSDNKAENKYSDVTYEFRLKEVLTLVWAATKDHAKYAAPKGNQTKETELHDRVKTLFDAFEKINSGICHHGVRNELVFSLNRVYQVDDKPVELLDDSLLVIMGIVRNVIANKLFSKYSIANADEKKAIEKAMINWMKEVNPQEILKTLDVDIENLKSDISKLFLAHGLNPAEKIVKDPIEFTLNQLEFAYDMQYPKVLELVNNIFSAVVNESTPCYRALEKVKIWIEAEYSFGTHLHEQRVIDIDYVYQAYLNVLKYKSYLSVTNEERLNKFIGNCNNYFEHLALGKFPLVSPGLRIQIAELTLVIEEYKNDKLGGLIENFFCHWFGSNDENKTRKKLYKALLDKKIQDKILMTDAELANIAKHDNRQLDPYLINRIFLHAIIKKPAEWTDYFAYMFAQVLNFVKNQFNQPTGSQVAVDLRRDSYPDDLLVQLDWLLELRRNPIALIVYPYRIVLPENITNIVDMLSIFNTDLVDNTDHLNLYLRNKIQFNRIIMTCDGHYELPFEVLNIFIRENVATQVKNINDFMNMVRWLEKAAHLRDDNNFIVPQISETIRIMFNHCFNSNVFSAEIFDNEDIQSIIIALIRLGDVETMQTLVNHHLNLNRLITDRFVYAGVFEVVDNEQVIMIEFLAKNGFDLNNTGHQETLLDHAISTGKMNVIIPLLSLGGCVSSTTLMQGDDIFSVDWPTIKKQLQEIVPDIRNVKTAAEAYIALRFLIDNNDDRLRIYCQHKEMYCHAILQNPKILKYFPDVILKEIITKHCNDIIKSWADYEYYMSNIVDDRFQRMVLAKCVTAGMDANSVIKFGLGHQPLICFAMAWGDLALIEVLLQHNVDVNAEDSDGKSALDIAIKNNDTDIFILLAKYNVNITKISAVVVAAGYHHTLILTDTGKLYACGDNEYGKLGLGDNEARNTPTEVTGILDKITQVIASDNHTLILTDTGKLYGCGNNYSGQLGLGDNSARNIPTEVTGISGKITQVSAGSYHTLILTDAGKLYGCGNNYSGQLGLRDNSDRDRPTEVTNIPGKITQVIAGNFQTFILTNTGKLYACGKNEYGQLGLGDNVNRNTPTEVTSIPDKIMQVIAGGYYIFILTDTGKLYACGSNCSGQLGLGNHNTIYNRPTEVTGIPGKITQVIAGHTHTLILTDTGKLYACGNNTFGELGLGDNRHRNRPTEVTNIPGKITQVIAGSFQTFILTDTGKLYACGRNNSSQLGLGDNKDRNTPTEVPLFAKQTNLLRLLEERLETTPSLSASSSTLFAGTSGVTQTQTSTASHIPGVC